MRPRMGNAWEKIIPKLKDIGPHRVAALIPDSPTLETGIILNDIHVPHHDKDLLRKVVAFIKGFGPDYIFVNGDLLDMNSVGKYLSNPDEVVKLSDEFSEGRQILADLANAAPRSKRFFIEGNHEFRMNAYIWQNARALNGLDGLSVKDQLQLDQLGYKYISSGQKESYYDLGPFLIGHFNMARAHSGYTAKGLLDRYNKSLVQAHVHRGGSHYRTQLGVSVEAHENFCLCDPNPSYVLNANWQQGFSLFRIDGDWFDIEPVSVKNGKCRYF